ncbi:hypothetical protein IAU60_006773 [Kwoniella sp. DSM 27419]
MIIPPDPEKDPNIFSASASTPSLFQPSEYDDTTSRWDGDGESLPPYDGRRRSRVSLVSVDEDQGGPGENVFDDRHASSVYPSSPYGMAARQTRSGFGEMTRLPGLIIPAAPAQTHAAATSSSGSLTPTATGPSATLPRFHSPSTTLHPSSTEASTSKLWEGSPLNQKQGAKGKRTCGVPPPPEGLRRWWRRWRRWVQAVLVVVLIGIGLAIGLLVGLRHKDDGSREKYDKRPPWMDQDTDGKRVTTWSGYGSFNFTYDEGRDGPSPSEGNFTDCNLFSPLNFTASPFNTLFTPFPETSLSLASFSFPLSSAGLPPSDLFIQAHGLASSGTLTFVGADAAEPLIASGVEGQILVDVIVRYSGSQSLGDMMRVCNMTRGDGGLGIGIYSATETDGKISNPYKLNPALVPTSAIVVRLPPSLFASGSQPLYLPSFSVSADRMAVHFGRLDGAVAFGDLTIAAANGGLYAQYAEAERASIMAVAGDVRGRLNVSESLVVNITTGSIDTDIILFDPRRNDNTTVLPPTTDYTVAVPRDDSSSGSSNGGGSGSGSDADSDADSDFEGEMHALFNATANVPTNTSATSHLITTNLFTSEGSVDIRYIHHPLSVDLSAIIATQEGNMDITVNPNYVGPFVAKTTFGQVNIPPPGASHDLDPYVEGRLRQLLVGPINVQPESPFAIVGYNTTLLADSTDTISGAIYWAGVNGNGTVMLQTMAQVQGCKEARGNSLVVLGGWGNVAMTFDGQ